MVSSYKYYDLLPFYDEMITEYIKHYPEKTDTWKKCDIEFLLKLFQSLSLDFMDDTDNLPLENPDELIDIANICAFIWLRINKKV